MASASIKQRRSKPKTKGAGKKATLAKLANAATSLAGQNDTQAFEAWRKHLKARKRATKTEKILGTSIVCALTWSLPSNHLDGLFAKPIFDEALKAKSSVEKGKKTVGKKATPRRTLTCVSDDMAEQWILSLETQEPAFEVGVDALTWCHALAISASELSRESWIGILDATCDLASEGYQANDVAADQLLSVELPLALAWQFPEVDRCDNLASHAASRLTANILNLLDGQGMIRGDLYTSFGFLAASWTRCLAMIKELRGIKTNKDAREEYSWMIRNLLRLHRADGLLALSTPGAGDGKKRESSNDESIVPIIRAGLKLTEDNEDIAIGKLRLDEKKVSAFRLPDQPSFHSEWSGIAVLQADWNRKSPRLALEFTGPEMRAELSTADRLVFSTAWQSDILVDGVQLDLSHPKEVWESTCWFSDDESDYFEAEIALTGDWRLQRQFLLAREAKFLITADNLIRREPHPTGSAFEIDYRLTIPMANGITGRDEEETRESILKAKKNLAMVFPLGLPEWRMAPGQGDSHFHEGAFSLRQKGRGMGLNAPLFFDLAPSRFRLPRTWRQLTIAETRRIVSRDEAVGYRIQIGTEQWLMYRSLTPFGNRTLIGHNLSSDFFFGKLNTDGQTETLVEIE